MSTPIPSHIFDVLEDIREYLDDRADVTGDGTHPNKPMALMGRLDEAMEELRMGCKECGK